MKKDAFNQQNKTASKVGEIVWYNTKELAIHAGAVRALDCFSLGMCHGIGKSPWQTCIDSPYMLAMDAPLLPDLPSGIMLPGFPYEAATTEQSTNAYALPQTNDFMDCKQQPSPPQQDNVNEEEITKKHVDKTPAEAEDLEKLGS